MELFITENEVTVMAGGELRATLTRAPQSPPDWWRRVLDAMLFEYDGQQWRWTGETFEALDPPPPPEDGGGA